MKLNLKPLSLSALMASTMLSGASAMEEILEIKISTIKQEKNKHTIVVSQEEGEYNENCFTLHPKLLERAWDLIKPTEANQWTQQDTLVKIELSNGKTFLFSKSKVPMTPYFPYSDSLMVGISKTQGTYVFKDLFYTSGPCIENCGIFPCDHETFPGLEMSNFSFKLTDISPPKIEEKEIILSPLSTIQLIPIEKYPVIKQGLFSKYDETTKLYTYLEPVTEKNREYFISIIKHHGDVVLRPLYKEHEMHNLMSMNMPFEGGGDGYFSSQPTFYFDDSRLIFQDDNELPKDQTYNKCREYFKNNCIQNTNDFDNATYNALRMIDGTLEGFNKGDTWIAYSMSERLSGKSLAEDKKWLTSPSLQIFMPLKFSEHFYSGMGIFRSTTAISYDKMKGIKRGSIGTPFHKEVAFLVKEANPNTQAMITRPLPSMAKVFKESGIPFISTSSHYPIKEKDAIGIQHVYTNGGGYEVKLHDQLSFLDSKHWFTTIPVLGGVLDNEGCPFVMTEIKNLLEWKPSKN